MFSLCGCMYQLLGFQKSYKRFTNSEDFLVFFVIIITIFLRVVDVQSDSMITSNIASAAVTCKQLLYDSYACGKLFYVTLF